MPVKALLDMTNAAEMFPIPLTPIEVCWILEDSPSHPMQFFLRLHLDSKLKRQEFEAAVQSTIQRHPLFTALVRQVSSSKWQWIAGPEQPLLVIWQSGDPASLPEAVPLNIFEERGLRVTVVEGQGSSAVFLQFQHTVCDGLSASDFAGDLLTAYAAELDPGANYKYKRIDPVKLLDRGDFGLSGKQKVSWLFNGLLSLKKFRGFYKSRPIMLVSKKPPAEDDPMDSRPAAFFRRYSRQESVVINKQARAAGTNVNGMLLANMFAVFGGWRCETQEGTKDCDLFRVTIPLSLRGASHRTIPAANVVSLVCFDRSVADTKDYQSLQKSLDRDIGIVVKEYRGLILPFALKLLQRWPNKLAAGIRRKRFSGSTLISNLGPVLTNCHLPKSDGKVTIGDLTVDGVEFLPVLRPGHCATMAACTYGGRITLSMHFDCRMISESEANELFLRYTSRLDADAV